MRHTRRRSRKWRARCSCGWETPDDLTYFDAAQAANAHRLLDPKRQGSGRTHLTVITRIKGPGVE